MSNKIVVDFDRCISAGNCMKNAPDVFEVRDDGFLYVLDDQPGDELLKAVQKAVRGCPTQAISIQES